MKSAVEISGMVISWQVNGCGNVFAMEEENCWWVNQLSNRYGRSSQMISFVGLMMAPSSSWCSTFPGKASRHSLGGSSTSSTNGGAGKLPRPNQTSHYEMPASPLIELVLDVPRRSKPVFPGRVEHQLDQWRRRQTSQPDQTSPMKAG